MNNLSDKLKKIIAIINMNKWIGLRFEKKKKKKC